MLRNLTIRLGKGDAIDEQSLDMLKALLISWNADDPDQSVYLQLYHECAFTRQACVDLLRKMGQVLEGWLQSSLVPSGADGEARGQHRKPLVVLIFHDQEVWKSWWWMHIKKCFPTFAKSKRIKITYLHRECCRNKIGRASCRERVCLYV